MISGQNGGFHTWGYPNSWMAFHGLHPWMITRGYPYFRKTPIFAMFSFGDSKLLGWNCVELEKCDIRMSLDMCPSDPPMSVAGVNGNIY